MIGVWNLKAEVLGIVLFCCFLCFKMDAGMVEWRALRKDELLYELRARGAEVDSNADVTTLLAKAREPGFVSQQTPRKYPQYCIASELFKCVEIVESFSEFLEELRVDFQKDRFRRIWNRVIHWELRLKDILEVKLEVVDREKFEKEIQRLGIVKMELTNLKKSRSQETTREQKQGSGVANEAQVPVKVSNLDRKKDYLSLIFSNMPNPFESVLKKGMVFSVSSIQAVMHFLRVLVQFKGICRAFHLDEASLLHLMFPFANGVLTNRVLAAIEDEKTLLDFHKGILNEFIPDKTRRLLFGKYFYRKQGDSETLLEYVEELKVIEKVFVAGLTESQIVDAALSGACDPKVRAQYISANQLQIFLQLDELCVRNQAILDSGALAGTTPTRSVVLGQGNRCFVCNKAGHFARECNRRGHVEQNQRKSEEVVRVVSREISAPSPSVPRC
ncbi:uncharacterized protein [Periplaneta americana]|uniref:uncharacterized protein n=1 Tax=Periplaneta americana TaxID=6978 RepID=UPI0037E90B25